MAEDEDDSAVDAAVAVEKTQKLDAVAGPAEVTGEADVLRVGKMPAMPVPAHMQRDVATEPVLPRIDVPPPAEPQDDERDVATMPSLPDISAALAGSKPKLALNSEAADDVAVTQPSRAHVDEEVVGSEAPPEGRQTVWASEELVEPPSTLTELGRAALILFALMFPIFAGLVLVRAAVDAWYAPVTPALLYVLVAMPIAVMLRQTIESDRIEAPVPRPGFMLSLVLGLFICAAWTFGPVREKAFARVGEDPSIARRALADRDPDIAAAACHEAIVASEASSTITAVVESVDSQTLGACMVGLPPASTTAVGREVVRRFERLLIGENASGLSCEDVELMGGLRGVDNRRRRALWSCVTQSEDSTLRGCCAADLSRTDGPRITAALGDPELDLPTGVVEWLLAATFGRTVAEPSTTAVAEQLGLPLPTAQDDVLRLTCNASFGPRGHDLIRHVRASLDAACPDLSTPAAQSLTSEDWFALCAALEPGGASAFCPVVERHVTRGTFALASGVVAAAIAAHRYGAYSPGIKSGFVAEQRRAADTTIHLLGIEDRLTASETGVEREQSLESVRELRQGLGRAKRADRGLHGFAPIRR